MRDMREILLTARSDAPPARHSVEDIVAAGQRRRRRAFAQRLGGAGLAVVAVATAVTLVSVNLAVGGPAKTDTPLLPAVVPTTPAVPAPSPPFSFTFGGYKVDDYRVLAPDEVTPEHQRAGVLRDVKNAQGKVTTHYVGTLTVYQPRMFDPARYRTGTRLTVQGRDAFHAEVEQPLLGSWGTGPARVTVLESVPSTITVKDLAWQYAPEAWAVLESEASPDAGGFPEADQIKVAERFAVAAGGPVYAKVPFRTGYLPDGFTLRAVSGQSMTAENRGMVTFVYAKPQRASGPLAGSRDLENDPTVTSVVVSILWVDTPPPDAVKRKSRCNPGQHWCSTTLPGGKFWVAVEDPSKTLPDRELLKVADGLAFATITDPNTWYPVA